jgi:hypothetical protein
MEIAGRVWPGAYAFAHAGSVFLVVTYQEAVQVMNIGA